MQSIAINYGNGYKFHSPASRSGGVHVALPVRASHRFFQLTTGGEGVQTNIRGHAHFLLPQKIDGGVAKSKNEGVQTPLEHPTLAPLAAIYMRRSWTHKPCFPEYAREQRICIQSRLSRASRKRRLKRGKGFFASLSKAKNRTAIVFVTTRGP